MIVIKKVLAFFWSGTYAFFYSEFLFLDNLGAARIWERSFGINEEPVSILASSFVLRFFAHEIFFHSLFIFRE